MDGKLPAQEPESTQRPRLSRRKFLALAAGGLAGLAAGGAAYTFLEAGWIRVARTRIAVPRLPPAFAGKTLAFLSDIHHGEYTSLDYVRCAVDRTNALAPDLICLGGDYVLASPRFIEPCLRELARLRAPLGVFAVKGNHDAWEDGAKTTAELARGGIEEVTNRGLWLEAGGDRLRVAGVDDLWTGEVDLDAALGDAKESDACVLLSHNPDVTEEIADPRVSLVLSGHTHGGQVVLPFIGAPVVPSRFGQKYLSGLCQGPHAQVFVTRGLGTIYPPVRFACRPEINLIELA